MSCHGCHDEKRLVNFALLKESSPETPNSLILNNNISSEIISPHCNQLLRPCPQSLTKKGESVIHVCWQYTPGFIDC